MTIAADAPLIEAARLLRAGTDLVVACDPAGLLVGVITKTEVVGQISECQGAGCTIAASLVMTGEVVLCRPRDWLRDAWERMNKRGLKNIPIVDEYSRPLGVLNARDALQVLLQESKDEEALLRDYVMSIGYQ
ncbi:MAG: CBS domain-containing protein [Acetobacteraceae bacterium]